MSNVDFPEESVDKPLSVQDVDLSAGSMLRMAREAAGLHVAALAVSMKIPVKKLEALESDRLDLLHDIVFVRALAASVCRSLKMDPAPVLAKLPSTVVRQLSSDARRINAPFHSAGNSSGARIPVFLAKPQALILLVLLASIAAVLFLPEIKRAEITSEKSVQTSNNTGQSESVLPESPAEPIVASTVANPVGAVASAEASASISSFTVEPRSLATSSPLEIKPVPDVSASSSSAIVVFRARSSSWVKVVDSAGVVQLSKTLSEGAVIAVSGAEPLSVVVGRADAVDVEVRGKPVMLTEFAKENVARFEVK
jgi:cytoskeleton protein RodZ